MLYRFSKQEHAAEIYENQPIGTYVKHLDARSTSSLFFEIIDGNKDDMFFINPSTGVIITKRQLDYELNKFYNLSVEATNMVSNRAYFYICCETDIHNLCCEPYFKNILSSGCWSVSDN
jgi:protocadherin Fat 1/2/3